MPDAAPPLPTTEEPPPSLLQALTRIGPGLILAGAIVGTGELIATTNLGARAGFALLWLVLLSCFIKVFVQIELGRYCVSSGESTFAAFQRLPGPGALLIWWCLGMLLVTQMQIGAMISGVAQAVELAAPAATQHANQTLAAAVPPLRSLLASHTDFPWAVVTTLATLVLLTRGGYKVVEVGSTLLVVTFTLVTIACVALLPASHAVTSSNLLDGFRFRIPEGTLVAAFTMFGITGVGASELLSYPYWCLEKGYARRVGPNDPSSDWTRRARGWIRVMQLDAWTCMGIYLIATMAFYLLGAAVMHRQTAGAGLSGERLIPSLAAMYEPILGPRAATVFIVVGAFAVLYSTLFAATAGNARLITDFLQVQGYVPRGDESVRLRWIGRITALLLAVAFVLYLIYKNPVFMVTVGGLMQAASLPFIASAAVYLRYRRTDRRLTPGLVWDILLWLSLVGLTLAASYSLWNGITKIRELAG
jgi:Mn2+/Fe2+ NRAMP family transporter